MSKEKQPSGCFSAFWLVCLVYKNFVVYDFGIGSE
jgi:hypothetical protein